MAEDGEVEVSLIKLEPGKCYEHIEITRRAYDNKEGAFKYYSTNKAEYVGKFVNKVEDGYGDSLKVFAYFDDNETKKQVPYSQQGTTFFKEVSCDSVGGMRKRGMHKRSRKSRRNLKTRKNRK